MKIGNFNLMSYRHLPDDFSEKHDSIYIELPSELVDSELMNANYNEWLDELEFAESVGFDMLGVNEHHSNGYGMMPSPNLMAAALTRRTTDAALLVLGNTLALYNPAQRVAEEFAMLDCMSGGRLIAGFPVGTPMDTCYAYSANPSELRDRHYEAQELIMQAWTRPERFSFHGRFNQQRNVNITPRPVQRPHPPVWVPGGGSVETWRLCAENDWVYCYLTYFGYLSGQEIIQGFWNEMKELGREPNPYQTGIVQFVGVAETREEALKMYAEPAEYYFNNCLHTHPRWTQPPGYVTEETARKKIFSQVQEAARRGQLSTSALSELHGNTFEDMVDRGFVVIGSPDEVAEKLREIAISQNVGNLLLIPQFGNMNRELAEYNTELLGKQVKPQIEGIFANEWEHRWWPKKMESPARPQELAQ
ncbi:MAG: LLM class flavin-dependent oxidoreductase [bacterium]|nr:LLM class flavin-dependent oxidoreductase [Deltaproteobacteria bacterium]MCP4907990.1 LLM class flavin-dependent oxidoreductase [bacterium]